MKKLINVLNNKESFSVPPIWIMRQAGRYLPEYIQVRSKIDNFLDLCYNPNLACEVTIQPIKRFDFDSAIIFSDILVIPDALGVKVEFLKNHGPKLANFNLNDDLAKLNINNVLNHLKPVFEAINLTKQKLDNNKSLIGFCGAPWTLACYMIEGGGSKNFDKAKQLAIKQPDLFAKLIDILVEASQIYLSEQIKAGADIVKIFDSWAGLLSVDEVAKWIINPAQRIVNYLKKNYPHIPIIYFPKALGVNYLQFSQDVDCHAVAIDQHVDIKWAFANIYQKNNKIIQGNLDNYLLAFGSQIEIEKAVIKILETVQNRPFIFNLGHGILPQTPIENVEIMLKTIRQK